MLLFRVLCMASNYFFLVPRIVSDTKYFDVSVGEILRALDSAAGKFERTEEHETRDEYNLEQHVILRLNINCQSMLPQGWTIALKLHNERIDGIDWESEYTAADGTTQHGWHRHQWSQKEESAKFRKIPSNDLDNVDGREQFLIRAFSIMRITVSGKDYGDQLPIAESHPA